MAESVGKREVNSLRLRTFLDLLRRRSGVKLDEILGSLPSDLQRVLEYGETRTWIDTNAESLVFDAIASRTQSWDLMESAGRELIRGPLEQLLNRVAGGGRVEKYVAWLPALLGLFRTGLSSNFERGIDGRSFELVISGLSGERVRVVDGFFALGLTAGVMEYVQLDPDEATLVAVPMQAAEWPDARIRPLGFGKGSLVIHVRSGELNQLVSEVRRKAPRLSWTTSPRDAFVKQVIARSAQLFHDKRELSTAVEYLNMANEELEKEIRANKKELRMAANIQKGFIPRTIPDWQGLQFWVHFAPMSEVSGDLFDYLPLEGNRMGLLVADVSGHGVPAALISAIAKISFQSHRGRVPSEIFSQVNMELLSHVKMEGYLTAFFAVFDLELGMLYSTAGFPPPMVLRADTGQVESLDGTGTLLGMFPDAGDLFLDFTLQLRPGDKMFVFTDGLLEGLNPADEQFGVERIRESIADTRGMSIKESCEHIIQRYEGFTLGTETHDDLTLVGMMASPRRGELNDLLGRGRAAFRAGKPVEALAAAEEAYALFPRNPAVLYTLAKYLATAGRYEHAMERLREYGQFKPYDPNAHTIHAYCLHQLGHLEQAERKLKQSLNLRGENASALLNLGRVYLRMGRHSDATEVIGLLERRMRDMPAVRRLRALLNAAAES